MSNYEYYNWIEVPVEFLQSDAPADSEYGFVYNVEGEVLRPKTLEEFIIKTDVSLDGTKVLILLSCKEQPFGRSRAVNLSDLASWKVFLNGDEDWLDIAGYKSRISSEEYTKTKEVV